MNFKSLTDAELEMEIKLAVDFEKKAQIRVLHLLAECERRRIYSKTHPSLFEYCVSVLKYSQGAAQSRIDTDRAIKLIPEIEVQIILAISPESVPLERRRELTPEKTEIKIIADQDLLSKLDRIKALLSHKNPCITDGELIRELANMALQKLDPCERKAKRENKILSDPKELPAPAVILKKRKYISKHLKRALFKRDGLKCSYPQCNSLYFLEIDHIKPVAWGGENRLENLRVLCRAHNQRAAINLFGADHMRQFSGTR